MCAPKAVPGVLLWLCLTGPVFAAAPVVNSISPSSGAAGQVLTLTGTGLSNAEVLVGGGTCTPKITPTDSTFSCTLPHSSIRNAPVVARNVAFESSTPVFFTYQPLSCAAGYASPTGFAPCYPCAKGTSQSNQGATSCNPCGIGRFTSIEASSICASCIPGTFSSTTAAHRCQKCGKGSFASSYGSEVCQPCAAGKYAPEQGAAECLQCPAGTASATSGSSSCFACPQGSFTSSPGNTGCQQCQAGTYASQARSQTCLDCPAGTFASTGQKACTACPAGTSSSVARSETCQLCTEGTYSVQNSVVCQNCPEGTSTEEEGAFACVSCLPGQYKETLGSGECQNCPANTYNPFWGASACMLCPEGTLALGEQNTACTGCPEGQYYDTETHTCNPCEKGYYQPWANSMECLPCPVGTFTNELGSTACQTCGVGETTFETGSSSCSACDFGKILLPTQPPRCGQCPPGTMHDEEHKQCVPCPQGSFSSSEGSSACHSCAPRTYQPLEKSSSCMPCPEGHVATAEHTACTACIAQECTQPNTCTARKIGGCCISNDDCNDGNTDTVDTCSYQNRCVHNPNSTPSSPVHFYSTTAQDVFSNVSKNTVVARIEVGGADVDTTLTHIRFAVDTPNPANTRTLHVALHKDANNDGVLDEASTPFAHGYLALNQTSEVLVQEDLPNIAQASLNHWIVTAAYETPPTTPGVVVRNSTILWAWCGVFSLFAIYMLLKTPRIRHAWTMVLCACVLHTLSCNNNQKWVQDPIPSPNNNANNNEAPSSQPPTQPGALLGQPVVSVVLDVGVASADPSVTAFTQGLPVRFLIATTP
jgi:hypothetical protein